MSRSFMTAALALLLLSASTPLVAQDGVFTQTYELQPGWNAIFVEMLPEPADMDAIFGGLPVESVWGFFPPIGQIDFVDDPAQGLDHLEGWRGWYPRPRPEALLSNLFGVEVNRAYLVKLDGNAPVTLRISGRPVNKPLRWVPDSFNLVGFQVDPAGPPTFGAFLAPSAAHAGQPIYRLAASGVWQLLPSSYSATIRPGEAYWVFTQGNSNYQGPLEVETGAFDGLEYSASLDEQRLIIKNRSQIDAAVRVRQLASSTAIPFLRRTFNEDEKIVFEALPADSTYPTVPGQDLFLQLGVSRGALSADRSEQLLEITDLLGSRRLVFAGVTRTHPRAPLPGSLTVANEWAGLWVGEVSVNKVSQSLAGDGDVTTPKKVGAAFSFRILLHVDASGQVRLLKEVTQMWKDGTTRPDPANPGFNVVDVPGRFVLITDPALVPSYEGAVQRDGVPVGLRVSTVAYDFAGHSQAMTGQVNPSGQLRVEFSMPAEAATNPYQHRYHPDHDNLDAQFLNPLVEAFDIDRSWTLEFSPTHPDGRPGPAWGSSELGGIFKEEVAGMHRNLIYTEGLFRLTRVAATPQLNH